MRTARAPGTRERLIAAASALFAERGFHGTKIREIAGRGRVNVAAGNYHYGSKKALYLAVLRTQFADIRARLARRGASWSLDELTQLAHAELEALLRTRVQTMLDLLVGPPPGLHGTLMQREMSDPSEALPVIVEEFVRPMMHEMGAIVSHLATGLDGPTVDRCVHSIIGQVLFYRTAMPAMLRLLDVPEYPRGFTRTLAAHITEFSLGGMARLRAGRARGRHAR